MFTGVVGVFGFADIHAQLYICVSNGSYRVQAEQEAVLAAKLVDSTSTELPAYLSAAEEILSGLKHRPWQACYRMFELNQDLPHDFAASCRNPSCLEKKIIGDGTFQTVIKSSYLKVKPLVREEVPRPILSFQSHILIKRVELRKLLTQYGFDCKKKGTLIDYESRFRK